MRNGGQVNLRNEPSVEVLGAVEFPFQRVIFPHSQNRISLLKKVDEARCILRELLQMSRNNLVYLEDIDAGRGLRVALMPVALLLTKRTVRPYYLTSGHGIVVQLVCIQLRTKRDDDSQNF